MTKSFGLFFFATLMTLASAKANLSCEMALFNFISLAKPQSDAQLSKSFRAYVRKNAGEDQEFNEISYGIFGSHGYLLNREQVLTVAKISNAVFSAKYAKEMQTQILKAAKVFVVLETAEEPQMNVVIVDTQGKFSKAGFSIGLLEAPPEDKMLAIFPTAIENGYFNGFKAIYMLLKPAHHILLGTAKESVSQDFDLSSFE